ncbi:hypothetical protein [Oleidesulfovibrio sp.]|uniref:hypothetical protein n=1 Tax=Oleidesulfovibrio sp. TaxID=2909707 RepID=UPI003A88DA68
MSKYKRYRKIAPCIWNDEKFRKVSNEAKLVIFFLLTHPDLTQLGALRGNMPGLAYDLGVELKAFEEAFQEVLAQGMAKHDGAMLIWFPNFLKYNMPESPNVIRSWLGGFDDLPESPLKNEILQSAKATVDGLSGAFKQAFGEAFPKGFANQEQEQEQEQDKEGTDVPLSKSQGDCDVQVSAPPSEPEAGEEPEEQKEEPAPMPLQPETKPKSKAEKETEFAKAVVTLFNRVLVDEQPEGRKLPKVTKVTAQRVALVKARAKSCAELKQLAGWEAYFQLVSQCSYLLGVVKPWSASFDWLLNVNNFIKVSEGQYLDREAAGDKGGNGLATGLPELDRVKQYARQHGEKGVMGICKSLGFDPALYLKACSAELGAQ